MKLTSITKRMVIGFVADVPAGQSMKLESKPQVPVKWLKLFVSERGISFFDILDIQVAGVSMLPAAGAVPAVAFSTSLQESAQAPSFAMEKATSVGDVIVVFVRNNNRDMSLNFGAWMFVGVEVAPLATGSAPHLGG